MRRIIEKKMAAPVMAVILAMGVCPSPAAVAAAGTSEERETGTLDPEEQLKEDLQKSAEVLLECGEDVRAYYDEPFQRTGSEELPVRFDLRDLGVVTDVKDQGSWSTCWAFAALAASETSILSDSQMTAEEFEKTYGMEMDLSEKQLTWFAGNALPVRYDGLEKGYYFEPSQGGEGMYYPVEGVICYGVGGNNLMSMSSLSGGTGPVFEASAVYGDSEGNEDYCGDWSLPEKERFGQVYELKDVNLLPNPGSVDDEGNYTFHPEAVQVMKQEIMKGHALSAEYYYGFPEPLRYNVRLKVSIEDYRKDLSKQFRSMHKLAEEDVALYVDYLLGKVDPEALSRKELKKLIQTRLQIIGLNADLYEGKELDRGTLISILDSIFFGIPLEELVEREREEGARHFYMVEARRESPSFAQYTYDVKKPNHGVTIVGWDDDFPADCFKESRRPPGDGAWIVKNSFGEYWGDEGYFYLSYYDKNLICAASYEYVLEDGNAVPDSGAAQILMHDYMPAEKVSSTLYEEPVSGAGVFRTTDEGDLKYISVVTGDQDAEVPASVYLLKDDRKAPTDGTLLDTVTETFPCAGYHRLQAGGGLHLAADSRISVVVTEKVQREDGEKYALVTVQSLGEKGMEAYNENDIFDGEHLVRWCVGIVGPGENYVSFAEGDWRDWSDILGRIEGEGLLPCLAFDNLPIKAYIYEPDTGR